MTIEEILIEQILIKAQKEISQIEGCPVIVHHICIHPDPKKQQAELLKLAVADVFQMPWQSIRRNRTRRRKFVLPKKIFLYLNQIDLKVGPRESGFHLGFDHTVAIHHRRSVRDLLSVKDKEMVRLVEQVRTKFNELKPKLNENISNAPAEPTMAEKTT